MENANERNKNPVAWSYSRLSSYELCPKKYHAESVAKSVPFVKNEQALYGEQVHKAFEDYFKKAKPLPLNLKHWTPTLELIGSAPGEQIAETKIALSVNYEPVEYYSKDAWLRVISDLTIVNKSKAWCVDWKTGKPRNDDGTQLKLNAAVTFLLDPDITEITLSYLYLQTKSLTATKMNVNEAPEFWASILPRVWVYTKAHEDRHFPPRPGWICRFCPVKSCEFWERK